MLNLRRHTYKRPQDQTTAEVCAHIESVQARERRLPWIDRRIAVLEVLPPFCSSEDAHLTEALAAACGSGNIGPAAWLIEHGADIHLTSWNAFRHAKVDCLTNAETYGERTGDLASSSPGTRTGRHWATGASSTSEPHAIPVDKAF